MTQKRPISSVLKTMEVNKVEHFPIIQMDTVRNAIQRIQLFFEKRYMTETDSERKILIVKRIA
jgi:hypothetical protein